MSLTKKDRKVRSGNGSSLPPSGGSGSDARFASAIASALKIEFGSGSAAVRAVAKLVDVNDRAAKNWFNAKNAPNGEMLVRLIKHSDRVLESVLALAERGQLLKAKRVIDAKHALRARIAELDALLRDNVEDR